MPTRTRWSASARRAASNTGSLSARCETDCGWIRQWYSTSGRCSDRPGRPRWPAAPGRSPGCRRSRNGTRRPGRAATGDRPSGGPSTSAHAVAQGRTPAWRKPPGTPRRGATDPRRCTACRSAGRLRSHCAPARRRSVPTRRRDPATPRIRRWPAPVRLRSPRRCRSSTGRLAITIRWSPAAEFGHCRGQVGIAGPVVEQDQLPPRIGLGLHGSDHLGQVVQRCAVDRHQQRECQRPGPPR